jgi:exopolysaccharide production protein ExoQ
MALPGLILGLVFIAFLLIRDSRRRPSLSWALWLPTFFLLVVGSRPLGDWFGGGAWDGRGLANDAAGSPLDQVFFFLIIIACLIIATRRHVQWGKLFAGNMPLLLFYCYFLLSIAWSEDPLGSSKRLFKDFGMLFVISVILSEKHPLEAVRAVYVRCACILFPLSAIFIKWFPNIARSFAVNGDIMYSGVTTQKNTLGEIVLVFGMFVVWDCLESWPGKLRVSRLPWDRFVLLLIGFWLLQICQSKTGLLCLLIGSALILRKGWLASKNISRVALLAALSLPYLLFFAQQYSSVIEPIVEAMGRNMTFTGRTDIWQHINLNTVNPLIGAGYYNFWGGSGGMRVNQAMHETIPNAHDGYVDMYLDGGFIGLVLLFFMLVAYGRRTMKHARTDRFANVRFAVIVVLIIYNISETTFARLTPLWFTSVLAFVDFPYLKNWLTKTKRTRPVQPAMEQAVLSPVQSSL